MARASYISFIPPEWNEREKKGLCPVCGARKEAFEPGMRKFCSEKCRDTYSDKIIYWDSLRLAALERDKYTCQKCGINQEKENEIWKKKHEAWEQQNIKFLAKNKEFVQANTERIQEDIQRHINSIHEDLEMLSSAEHMAEEAVHSHTYMIPEKLRKKLPHQLYDSGRPPGVQLEVDHIHAITNGGNQWDIGNLQTLCHKCHAEKTKHDMEVKRNMEEKLE